MVSVTYCGIDHEAGGFRSDSGAELADDNLDSLIALREGHLRCLLECEGSVVVHGDWFQGKHRMQEKCQMTKKERKFCGWTLLAQRLVWFQTKSKSKLMRPDLTALILKFTSDGR